MRDRKTFLIGVLSVSAALLCFAHLQLAQTAHADVEVSDDDYQLVTASTTGSDDGLYVLNKRKNMVAFFTWDPTRRALTPRDVRSLDGLLNGR